MSNSDLQSLPDREIIYQNDVNQKVEVFNMALNLYYKCSLMKKFTKIPAPLLTDNLKHLMTLKDKAKMKSKLCKRYID